LRRRRAAADRLVADARAARGRAVAPYSRFKVGAALETADGVVVTGCNIENASYGLTMCAERVALFKALSEGHRAFRRLAIVTAADAPTAPCGACRQLLWEFAGDIEIIAESPGASARWRMKSLLAHPFEARSIGRSSRAGTPGRTGATGARAPRTRRGKS
jgi:cytidine deaminase